MRSRGAIIESMAKKPKPDDKKQSQRFIEKAKELGADEGGTAFIRAIKKIADKKTSNRK